MNDREASDIDAQFHCGGAEQGTDRVAADFRVVWLGPLLVDKPISTEAVFAVRPIIRFHVAGVILGAEALGGGKVAVHVTEELIWAWIVLLVCTALDGIELNSFAIPQAPEDLVDSKPEDCNVEVVLATGFLLDELVGILEFAHKKENEVLIMVSFEVNTMLFRKVLEEFTESACWPEAL
jgi:hypothetical protein